MKKVALSLFVIAASAGYVWSQWNGQHGLGSAGALASGQPMPLTLPASAPAAGPVVVLQPAPFVTNEPANARESGPTSTASLSSPLVDAPPLPAPAAPHQPPAATEAAAAPSEPPAPAAPVETVAAASNPPAVPDPAPQSDPSGASAPALVNVPLPRLRPSEGPLASNTSTSAASTAASAGSAFGGASASRLLAPVSTGSLPRSRYADGTYTGPIVNAFYGLVQVRVTVHGGDVVRIEALRYPSDRRVSVRINRQALPMLRDEVISAQSANVDIVSGATLTSRGFIASLGAALQQARA